MLIILESPYAGDVPRNLTYARRAMRDSLLRGENPIASHLLYTQPGILDDLIPEQRHRGIAAGFAWHKVADTKARSLPTYRRNLSAFMDRRRQR